MSEDRGEPVKRASDANEGCLVTLFQCQHVEAVGGNVVCGRGKSVMMNSISVMLNMLMGVVPAAIVASSGRGMDSVSRMNATDIRICMERVHHLLVLMMSTNGLQKGLIVHGR